MPLAACAPPSADATGVGVEAVGGADVLALEGAEFAAAGGARALDDEDGGVANVEGVGAADGEEAGFEAPDTVALTGLLTNCAAVVGAALTRRDPCNLVEPAA